VAKKEGRLLTKKQKEEQRAAEIRKQALLASGVQIEGLQQQGSAPAAKRPIYGNRKKQPQKGGVQAKDGSPTPSSIPATPVSVAVSLPEPEPEDEKMEKKEEKEEADDVKSDWDASSDEEKPVPKEDAPKSDWDASSDEEKPAAKPAAKSELVSSSAVRNGIRVLC
jgi:translation initiation factor 5B